MLFYFFFCRNLSNYVEFYENQIEYSKKMEEKHCKKEKNMIKYMHIKNE